jgi:rSAM/selenodomain-associated transferase 1
LVVFAKSPEAGDVKTRLCPPLSEKEAAELQGAMLLDILSLTDSLPAARFLACTPRIDSPFFDLCAQGRTLPRLQQEGDALGQRMQHALSWGFGKGFSRVILIGSDSPDLPRPFIEEGFARLRTASCVVGPTEDGGYYLIGASGAIPPVFDDVSWGSEKVMTETLQHLNRHGVSFHLLPTWHDVDRPADLPLLAERIRQHISNGLPPPEKTWAYLENRRWILI